MQFFGRLKRSKQGVGSIIGAVFVILILLSGLTFYATYLSITDDYYETLGSMGDLGWSQNQERIVIKQVTLTAANNLNLTVENDGAVQSRLIWIGVFNKSAVPEDQTYYPLDEHLNPSEKLNIVTNFTVVQGLKYAIQLVTELGNTIQNVFYPASEVQCALSLTVASPTAYEGNNVTVMLTVTHNDTDVDTIQSLTASVNMTPGGLVQLVDNSPLTVNGLTRGGSAFFWWIYNTISTGTVTFNASYSQAPAGSCTLSTANIASAPSGGAGNVTITGVNCTSPYNPSQWNLVGSTQNVSGSVSDLANDDGSYAAFRSYTNDSTADISDFVDDNTSDVDGWPNKGTHSNFTAQQYGPDSINDILAEEKATGNFLVKYGAFTKATSVGSQTITGVGFLPKVIIFWWTRQTSYGELAGISMGYGFATNYTGAYQNRGVAFASNDAAVSSVAGRRRSDAYSIIILSSGTPALGAQANVTAYTNDGFILNWQTNEVRADIVHFVALGGSDLTAARTGSFDLATGTGTQDITGVGFQPDFVMFLWTFTEAADTNAAHAEVGMGLAASSTKRGAIVANSRNGRGTMDTWQQQRTDSCILLLDPTSGGQDAIADFNQFLADGFRLSKSDGPATNTPIFYLALKGGEYDVGSFDSSTTSGNQDITGVGFQPKLALLVTQGRSTSTSIGSTAELMFGAATASTERGVAWFEDPDNLLDSDNEMETLDTTVVRWRDRTAADTFSLRGSADFVSFLPNGFRLNWASVEATGRQIIYAVFGGRNYELDLEVRWTSANFSQPNEYLCIKTGVLTSESLRVDVRTGSSWITVIESLNSDSWNNVSVSAYLTSSTFTIRFKDGTSTGDIAQDSWNIDVTLLHVWATPNEYTAEVEFVGSSNLQSWLRLVWQIDSCWDIDHVTVTIQFYNFTLGDYATSGNGYINYTSDAIPDRYELKTQTIITNPIDFRNSTTGQWKVKIKGVKSTSTRFLMKVDWIDFETSYLSSGNTMPYNVWQWYTIRATSASGGPIPYAYVSIYANGTLVRFRNVTDKVDIGNPAWVRLDAGGQFVLEVKSAHGSGETFVLYAVVGSTVGQETVTQEAP